MIMNQTLSQGYDIVTIERMAAERDQLREQVKLLRDALEDLHKQLRAHVKMDVKKHFSLMVADAQATKALNNTKG